VSLPLGWYVHRARATQRLESLLDGRGWARIRPPDSCSVDVALAIYDVTADAIEFLRPRRRLTVEWDDDGGLLVFDAARFN
jgi:hypothetical protein